MDDSALALAKLINSPDFQRKLGELLAAKKAAEDAQASAEKAKAETEATVLAMNQLHTQQIKELAAAKAEHDKSAGEVALRIKLADSVKAEHEKRTAELNAREKQLEEREKTVDTARDNFTSALRGLGLTS